MVEPEAKSAEGPSPAEESTTEPVDPDKVHQHHISKILDEVLDEPDEPAPGGRAYKHRMFVDLLLGIGLLVATGGFTIGLMKIYITHAAQQSIAQRNYKAAISILRDSPLPGLFTMQGSDPEELLNQALYLDAMEKLDADGEDTAALKELGKIQVSSRFFDLAQEILKEHHKPSAVQLEGEAQHEASPNDPVVEEKKPILPEPEKEGSP
jgi:hypothetical protein